nr:spore germination protein [Paenibacillus eucommiae]
MYDNLQQIKKAFGNSTDLVIREIRIGENGLEQIAIIYIDGMADEKTITDFILESLLIDTKLSDADEKITESPSPLLIQTLKDFVLSVGTVQDVTDFDSLYSSVSSGNTVILLDGHAQGITASTKGWKDRGVTESLTESVVRGPREAFSETLRTNTSLIRRKIKSPNLWMETKQIGRVTQTDVAIMYIKGIANDKIVAELHQRLDRIDIDGILESGYIEELIQDQTYTPFPTVYNSERPDVIAAELLEGKVAIIIDGTPFVLVVPALFVSFLHAAEDYYHRADISSLVRFLRYIGMFIAFLGPSAYLAVTTFHQEMLHTNLLISLAAQREGIPFPAFIEALLMEVSFEILREAGIRMPKTIGPAVAVVGTLVIGQAAVEAGIVSPAMVIVVAITAISSFSFPSYSMANSFRMLRFPLMGLAASFGLFGIIIGVIALIQHLSSIRSFGVPYLSPFAPLIPSDQKDALIRVPWRAMTSRPRLINQKNINRERK